MDKENILRLEKDDILRIKIVDDKGVETGEYLEFDLEEIDLSVQYHELLEKENNTNSDYASLTVAKDRILNDTLPNLKNKLNDIIIDKIPKLKKEKELLELDLEPTSYEYFKISDLSISKNPFKPKKSLIMVIATFIGLVLGVFAVLVRGEIKKMKQKNLE